ncbi:MAG: hypothetical protein BWY09_01774 [Candidatus Hydrogenedentes bacterium ADurb.Bin179]|nr:MAG: hypothetical protein BWY09_01774 [Candidatus Hydrogenedentes bacterium ADurb.Bin179]
MLCVKVQVCGGLVEVDLPQRYAPQFPETEPCIRHDHIGQGPDPPEPERRVYGRRGQFRRLRRFPAPGRLIGRFMERSLRSRLIEPPELFGSECPPRAPPVGLLVKLFRARERVHGNAALTERPITEGNQRRYIPVRRP